MKRTFIFLIIVQLFFATNCYAQEDNDIQQINMLREFYNNHTALWSAKPPLPPDIFNYKIDSIIVEYCTNEMRQKAKEFLEYGFDIMTDEWGMDEKSLNTMKIQKDSEICNTYVISYIRGIPNPISRIEHQITLHVTLSKEGEVYKISNVEGDGIRLNNIE